MSEERKIYRYREAKSMPRGIEMQEFSHADGSITFVGQYRNQKDQQPNNKPKRVYRVELLPDMGDWRAAVFEDATRLVTLRGDSKWNVAYAALGALRGILHKRCCSTKGNRRAKRRAKNEEGK